MWENFVDTFYLNFIAEERWKYLTGGLRNTLIITFFACLLGIVLGFLVSMIRVTYERTGKMKVPNAICTVYLRVSRGTPVVLQLLIIYFVVFGSVRIDKILVAVLAFGINSGAYVAEICEAASWRWIRARWRPAEAWALITVRPCGISSCLRP